MAGTPGRARRLGELREEAEAVGGGIMDSSLASVASVAVAEEKWTDASVSARLHATLPRVYELVAKRMAALEESLGADVAAGRITAEDSASILAIAHSVDRPLIRTKIVVEGARAAKVAKALAEAREAGGPEARIPFAGLEEASLLASQPDAVAAQGGSLRHNVSSPGYLESKLRPAIKLALHSPRVGAVAELALRDHCANEDRVYEGLVPSGKHKLSKKFPSAAFLDSLLAEHLEGRSVRDQAALHGLSVMETELWLRMWKLRKFKESRGEMVYYELDEATANDLGTGPPDAPPAPPRPPFDLGYRDDEDLEANIDSIIQARVNNPVPEDMYLEQALSTSGRGVEKVPETPPESIAYGFDMAVNSETRSDNIDHSDWLRFPLDAILKHPNFIRAAQAHPAINPKLVEMTVADIKKLIGYDPFEEDNDLPMPVVGGAAPLSSSAPSSPPPPSSSSSRSSGAGADLYAELEAAGELGLFGRGYDGGSMIPPYPLVPEDVVRLREERPDAVARGTVGDLAVEALPGLPTKHASKAGLIRMFRHHRGLMREFEEKYGDKLGIKVGEGTVLDRFKALARASGFAQAAEWNPSQGASPEQALAAFAQRVRSERAAKGLKRPQQSAEGAAAIREAMNPVFEPINGPEWDERKLKNRVSQGKPKVATRGVLRGAKIIVDDFEFLDRKAREQEEYMREWRAAVGDAKNLREEPSKTPLKLKPITQDQGLAGFAVTDHGALRIEAATGMPAPEREARAAGDGGKVGAEFLRDRAASELRAHYSDLVSKPGSLFWHLAPVSAGGLFRGRVPNAEPVPPTPKGSNKTIKDPPHIPIEHSWAHSLPVKDPLRTLRVGYFRNHLSHKLPESSRPATGYKGPSKPASLAAKGTLKDL